MHTSVIIVNYNNRVDLEECLPSLVQSVKSDDEIIVVDNASSDGSTAWLVEAYPQIKLILNNTNQGYAGGNNLGAKHAAGSYLAFINPDTVVDQIWLEALTQVLDEQSEVGMATSRIIIHGQTELINTCGNQIHLSGITLCRGLWEPVDKFSNQELVGAVSGAAFIIRRDLFDELNGFDEMFFMYMEDSDLSWRVHLRGMQILFVPSSIVQHKYRLSFGPKKIFYQERNRYMMLLKSLRWITLFLMFPTLILSELVTWGFVLLRDRENIQNKFDAYRWVFAHWTEIMENRNQVQTIRKASDRKLLRSTTFWLDFEQTGRSLLTRVAKLVFNPIFWVLRSTLLLVVWW